MSREAAVVNLFFTLRMFLLGGIFLVYPRVTRRGLLFGTYVGEELAGSDAVRRVRRSWDRGVAVLVGISLVVGWGISLAGWPVPGNLTGTALLLLTSPLLYIRTHRKARELPPPATARRAKVSAAPLSMSDPRGAHFAWICLALCVLTGIATISYAALAFNDLPARIPTLGNLIGVNEEQREKSLVVLLYLPSFGLILSSFFALFALLITRAKRSVRAGTGGGSSRAQDSFRFAMSVVFGGTALVTSLFLTLLSVQMVRVAQARTEGLGPGFGAISAVIVLLMFAGLVWILRGHGQGGALREEGSTAAPLTGGLADNTHWLWGVMYINREDPSILVESRFGIGYTMNLGNRRAVLFLVSYLAALAGLAALVVTGVVS